MTLVAMRDVFEKKGVVFVLCLVVAYGDGWSLWSSAVEDIDSNHSSALSTSCREPDTACVLDGEEVAKTRCESKFVVTSTDAKTFGTDGSEVMWCTCVPDLLALTAVAMVPVHDCDW